MVPSTWGRASTPLFTPEIHIANVFCTAAFAISVGAWIWDVEVTLYVYVYVFTPKYVTAQQNWH
jgi:hypothetical protein